VAAAVTRRSYPQRCVDPCSNPTVQGRDRHSPRLTLVLTLCEEGCGQHAVRVWSRRGELRVVPYRVLDADACAGVRAQLLDDLAALADHRARARRGAQQAVNHLAVRGGAAAPAGVLSLGALRSCTGQHIRSLRSPGGLSTWSTRCEVHANHAEAHGRAQWRPGFGVGSGEAIPDPHRCPQACRDCTNTPRYSCATHCMNTACSSTHARIRPRRRSPPRPREP
jgi:hypothetical protein